jgi:hypothetical protein
VLNVLTSHAYVAYAGLNTGSMLFRNTNWTRRLVADLCAFAARAHTEDIRELILMQHALNTPGLPPKYAKLPCKPLCMRANNVVIANAQELKQHVVLLPGFHDTPLLYMALKRTPGNLDRVYFEGDVGRVNIGLNRHFAQVALLQHLHMIEQPDVC